MRAVTIWLTILQPPAGLASTLLSWTSQAPGSTRLSTADAEAAEEAAQEAAHAAARSEAPDYTGSSLKGAASSAAAAAASKAADTADRACAGAVIAAEHMLKSGQSAAAAVADEGAQVNFNCVLSFMGILLMQHTSYDTLMCRQHS
jgi:hypothetical protein